MTSWKPVVIRARQCQTSFCMWDNRMWDWVFRKATDHNTLLHANSYHPPWLIDNIPFGQIQRLRRICDSDQDFPNQSMDIQLRCQQRGYQTQTLIQAHNRAQSLERKNLLQSRPKILSTQKPYFVTNYSKEAIQIKRIIKKNWNIIECEPTLREVFTEPPGISFRRAPTIKEKLVKIYLSAPKREI